jgi:DNA-binding HxlR family transcriptional regulator
MPRNVRTYDHFCVLARALEQLGERWSLLVVRDLLSGPKRFTDLMDRCAGLTPKTLTRRLRDLEACGVLVADREPGRREVWYRLTPAGADLETAVDALSRWGLRHAWRPPRPGEPLHAEHLLHAVAGALNHAGGDHHPTRWHFRFADAGDYLLHDDGHRWALSGAAPTDPPPDLTVTASTDALARFVADPSPRRAADLHIDLAGSPEAVRRFTRLLRAFADSIDRRGQRPDSPPAGR